MKNIKLYKNMYGKELSFIFRFMSFFVGLNFIYFLCDGTVIKDFIFSKLTAEPIALVIQIITPAEKMLARGHLLISRYSSFTIVDGCEGIQSILILCAAILAFKARHIQKAIGLMIGIPFLYFTNLARIVIVFYMFKSNPQSFTIAHLYVGQTFIIILSVSFFIIWTSRVITLDEKENIS